ncbi:MAG TPA: hypothetical protein VL978_03230 [Puia sp.]|nr:hypothetical protein [Puia sp.]
MVVIFFYLFNTVVPILLLLLLGSFFHVLIHELGHALPVLFGSPGWATVYIGSYGDPGHSFGIRVGRLKIWIKYNPFLWFRGMCQPGGASFSINRQIGYVACGPLGSLLLGAAACGLLTIGAIPGFLRLFFGFLVLFSTMGLLGSIVPAGRRRFTSDGRPVYPDLILMIRLWKSKRLA